MAQAQKTKGRLIREAKAHKQAARSNDTVALNNERQGAVRKAESGVHSRSAFAHEQQARLRTGAAVVAGSAAAGLQGLAQYYGRDTPEGKAAEVGSYAAAAATPYLAAQGWLESRRAAKKAGLAHAAQAAADTHFTAATQARDNAKHHRQFANQSLSQASVAPKSYIQRAKGPLALSLGVAAVGVAAGVVAGRREPAAGEIKQSRAGEEKSELVQDMEAGLGLAIDTSQAVVLAQAARHAGPAVAKAAQSGLGQRVIAANVEAAKKAGSIAARAGEAALARAPEGVQRAAQTAGAIGRAVAPQAAEVAGKAASTLAAGARKAGELGAKVLDSRAGKLAGKAALPLLALSAAYEGYKGFRREGAKGAAIGVVDSLTFGAASMVRDRFGGPSLATAGPSVSPRIAEDVSMRQLGIARAAAERAKAHMQQPNTPPRTAGQQPAQPQQGGKGRPAAQVVRPDGMTEGYTRVQNGKTVTVPEYKTPTR